MYYFLYYLPDLTFFITGWLLLDLLGSGLFRLLVRPRARHMWGNAQIPEVVFPKEAWPEEWQSYLKYVGANAQETTPHVRLKMKGIVRSRTNGQWHPAECRVFFTARPLSMIWYADITRAFMVSVKATEQYAQARAFSTRWILSTFPFRWIIAKGDTELAQRNAFFNLAGAVWQPQWWQHYGLVFEKTDQHALCFRYQQQGLNLFIKARFNAHHELVEWSLWNENWQQWQAGLQFSDYRAVQDQQMPFRVAVLRDAQNEEKYSQAELEITDIVQKGDYAWW